MREENEFRDRPIERSVIVLGAITGVALYISVALFAIELFTNGSGQGLFWIAAQLSG